MFFSLSGFFLPACMLPSPLLLLLNAVDDPRLERQVKCA
jgi:hypothetical protein